MIETSGGVGEIGVRGKHQNRKTTSLSNEKNRTDEIIFNIQSGGGKVTISIVGRT